MNDFEYISTWNEGRKWKKSHFLIPHSSQQPAAETLRWIYSLWTEKNTTERSLRGMNLSCCSASHCRCQNNSLTYIIFVVWDLRCFFGKNIYVNFKKSHFLRTVCVVYDRVMMSRQRVNWTQKLQWSFQRAAAAYHFCLILHITQKSDTLLTLWRPRLLTFIWISFFFWILYMRRDFTSMWAQCVNLLRIRKSKECDNDDADSHAV